MNRFEDTGAAAPRIGADVEASRAAQEAVVARHQEALRQAKQTQNELGAAQRRAEEELTQRSDRRKAVARAAAKAEMAMNSAMFDTQARARSRARAPALTTLSLGGCVDEPRLM